MVKFTIVFFSSILPMIRLILTPLIIAIVFFVSSSAAAETINLKCSSDNHETESTALKKIANLAMRKSKHDLAIAAGGKTLHFKDKPPYDNPMEGGLKYQFCGYQDGFFLVSKDDSSDSTGILINQQTGAITPAGENVVLAPDKRSYVALVFPHCSDTYDWTVYTIDGQKTWTDGSPVHIEKGNYDFYLDEPGWTEKGELAAYASCSGNFDDKTKVTLKKTNDTWGWKPLPNCQSQ